MTGTALKMRRFIRNCWLFLKRGEVLWTESSFSRNVPLPSSLEWTGWLSHTSSVSWAMLYLHSSPTILQLSFGLSVFFLEHRDTCICFLYPWHETVFLVHSKDVIFESIDVSLSWVQGPHQAGQPSLMSGSHF